MADFATLDAAMDVLTSPAPGRVLAGDFHAESLSRSDRRDLGRQVASTRVWNLRGNVVGLGIGDKRVYTGRTDDLALVVCVKKKLPASTLDAATTVPPFLEIAGFDAPILTDVREVGIIRPHALTQAVRPLIGGYSVGHTRETGTLGCLVTRPDAPGKHFILSNSHVLAASGTAKVGDPIFQPGPDEGDTPATPIATLTDWRPFDFTQAASNRCDAAIAEINPDVVSMAQIYNIGVPKGARPYDKRRLRNILVQKSGRTTGHTWGKVELPRFEMEMTYPRPSGRSRGKARFQQQVLCSRYSDHGDSGALVLDDAGYAVGLHFAGSSDVSVFSPIQFVLEDLGIELVTAESGVR